MITCVIVSYNNIKYLHKAIESALRQTKPLDEIIVADDASTDGSQELIRALAAEYGKIRPIFREQNLGVARNKDLAIRGARGDLLTTLDGDDYYYDNKIELECRALNAFSDGVAYSNFDIVDANGAPLRFRDVSPLAGISREEVLDIFAFRRGQRIPRDFLLPKAIYERAGGIKRKFPLYEDWDFKIRLAALPVNWVWSGCVGMAYRQTGTGLASATLEEHAKVMRLVLVENEALLTEVLGPNGYQQALTVVSARGLRREASVSLAKVVRIARSCMIKEPGL